jgi:hypothetical protein
MLFLHPVAWAGHGKGSVAKVTALANNATSLIPERLTMRTLISLACLAALGGCAIIVTPDGGDMQFHSAFSSESAVDGNGMPARDERVIATLPRLQVDGPMQVEVRVGPAASIVVEADANLLPLIHTDARGDTLRIWSDRVRSKNPIHITYTVPSLSGVTENGSGRVSAVGLAGAPLEVNLNGSGLVQLAGNVDRFDAKVNGSGHVDAGRLRSASATLTVNGSGNLVAGEVRGEHASVSVHGSGKVQAWGAVRSLTVRMTGSGNADLDRLVSEQADLASTGSGGIGADVRRNLVAQGNASGMIRVHGNPAQRSISGKSVQLID